MVEKISENIGFSAWGVRCMLCVATKLIIIGNLILSLPMKEFSCRLASDEATGKSIMAQLFICRIVLIF